MIFPILDQAALMAFLDCIGSFEKNLFSPHHMTSVEKVLFVKMKSVID